jgi:4'-phosphopantetheinyl transferase
MFTPTELNDIIHYKPPPELLRNTPNSEIKVKLRRFYTYFCIKEAYIKLVGEGLLADWIEKCESRNVDVPRSSSGNSLWGEKIVAGQLLNSSSESDRSDSLEIWLHGEEVRNVRTEMQAFDGDYIITTMMTPSNLLGENAEFQPWKMLDLKKDILDAANAL